MVIFIWLRRNPDTCSALRRSAQGAAPSFVPLNPRPTALVTVHFVSLPFFLVSLAKAAAHKAECAHATVAYIAPNVVINSPFMVPVMGVVVGHIFFFAVDYFNRSLT